MSKVNLVKRDIDLKVYEIFGYNVTLRSGDVTLYIRSF